MYELALRVKSLAICTDWKSAAVTRNTYCTNERVAEDTQNESFQNAASAVDGMFDVPRDAT